MFTGVIDLIKAIVFDIGQTLVEYHKPLNWSKLYRPALKNVSAKCGYRFSEAQYQYGIEVLTKYNTRIHPRTYEITSDQMFAEISQGMKIPLCDLEIAKFHFYTYFRQDATVFPEVEETLKTLSDRGVLLGTLSDVAYAMDNVHALGDIASILNYIDYPLTSNDVGYRKPCAEGLWLLAGKMQVSVKEMAFVGDEEKDVLCAHNAGVYSILINRDGKEKKYGQDREIDSLDRLLELIHRPL